MQKCRVFSQNVVNLCFYKNVLFLIGIIEVYSVILTQKYLFLPLLPKSMCFVTFWLNRWAWCHRKNIYFIGCLHDPTNVQQTFSKCIQNTRELLDICWKFAGRLLPCVIMELDVCWIV